jgi:hypothetical protein
VPRFVLVPCPSRGDGFLGTGRRFQAIYFLTSGQVESQGYTFPATPLARQHFDGGVCADASVGAPDSLDHTDAEAL